VPFCGYLLERKYQLLLDAIGSWREVAEWHEEIRKLSTTPQRVLNKEQALERHLLAEPILESEVTGAYVYTGICSEIVVCHLRD
jgi:hypothetical protein